MLDHTRGHVVADSPFVMVKIHKWSRCCQTGPTFVEFPINFSHKF